VIRESVQEDAAFSTAWLQRQMMGASDPEIRLKLMQLMGQEYEKAVLVSSRAFDLIEGPWMPRAPIWPNKRQVVGIAFLVGFFLGILGVIVNEKARDFIATLRSRR
jgi:hypothetical protein